MAKISARTAPRTQVPTFTLSANQPRDIAADAIVINTAPAKGKTVEIVSHGFTPAQSSRLAQEITSLGGTGKSGEVITLPSGSAIKAPLIVAVGLGDFRKNWNAEQYRRGIGNAVRSLTRAKKIVIAAGHDTDHLYDSTLAAALAAYSFSSYSKTDKGTRPSTIVLALPVAITPALRTAVKDATTVATSMYLVRDLINTPPNDLAPADLAQAAKDSVDELPVTVKIWDEKALAADNCGGILGVGMGSSRKPRLVKMTYAPKGAKASLSLIGKGITFDTGGISIKPASKMHEMKADMSGAATVIGAVKAIAALGLNVKVTGWVAAAENMPSSTAQRPGDVLTTFDGTTVEVLNTDAEGRLVLADAIGMSVLDKPDLMIDIATLTGAQRIALGRRTAGVMGNNDDARTHVVEAANLVGDEVWPMPLPSELRETLDSDTADIANIGDGLGGMLSAAVFLKEFVPDSQPWVHIDVAGPAFNDAAAYGYTPKGGTAALMRTFVKIAQNMSEA